MQQVVQGEASKEILRGIALTTIILSAAVYLPLLGFVCTLILPLPVLFYRSKLGRINGALIPIVAAIILLTVNKNMRKSTIQMMCLLLVIL